MQTYYGYVYLTTNLVNGKQYIGCHRAKEDDDYIGSGKLFLRAVNKYGKSNFFKEILEWCYSEEELFMKESYYGKLFNAVESKSFYNVSELGHKNPVLYGERNGFYNKTHSNETKQKLSDVHKGKIISEETKLKMSQRSKELWEDPEFHSRMTHNRLGHKHSEETKLKIGNSNRGKTMSKESIEKIKISRQRVPGKPHTEETKLKISQSQKLVYHWWQDKINKNPNKIKKSAETHTGMKRSDETRLKMSLAKKDRSPPNKGKLYYKSKDGVEGNYFKPGEEPTGWVRGTGKRNNSKW